MNAGAFSNACNHLGVDLTPAQLEAFSTFESNLYEANKVMNLTRVPPEECWRRHFVDSLLFQDLIPQIAKVLDIGAGPGFPAWPLACARPDLEVTALDSNGKMLDFLDQNPLPNLRVVQARAEEWARTHREKFDFVTGRALAPLAIQLEVSAAFVKKGGLVVPMRSRQERAEIESLKSLLGLDLEGIEERALDEETTRLLPIYRKVAQTPRLYPRGWAEIRKRPLKGS